MMTQSTIISPVPKHIEQYWCEVAAAVIEQVGIANISPIYRAVVLVRIAEALLREAHMQSAEQMVGTPAAPEAQWPPK